MGISSTEDTIDKYTGISLFFLLLWFGMLMMYVGCSSTDSGKEDQVGDFIKGKGAVGGGVWGGRHLELEFLSLAERLEEKEGALRWLVDGGEFP
jgi:hypothetical protein